MTSYSETYFGRFVINPHDRITIRGRAMRLAYQTRNGYVLKDAGGTGVSEFFDFVTLSWLNFSEEIQHEPDFFKPKAAVSDLGITYQRTIAGSPSMRATVESIFREASKAVEARVILSRGGKQDR